MKMASHELATIGTDLTKNEIPSAHEDGMMNSD